MISEFQKLTLFFVTAIALHLLFFGYHIGGAPDFEIGESTLPLASFRLFGIYSLGVHIFYNEPPLYLFGGVFIPQLFGVAVPMVLLLFVGFVSYNKWNLDRNEKQEKDLE